MGHQRPTLRWVLFSILIFLIGVFAGSRIDSLYSTAPERDTSFKFKSQTGEPSSSDEPPGRWRRKRSPQKQENVPELDDAMASLPYLSGYNPATGKSSVIQHNREKAYEGLNFWVSGHAPEACLMDMDGKVLHRWRKPWQEIWPSPPPKKNFWSQARPLENGNLIALFQYKGIFKLNSASQVLWKNDIQAHHSIYIMDNKNIVTLTRRYTRGRGKIKTTSIISEDYIALLSPGGKLIKEVPIIDLILNSDYSPLLEDMKKKGDVLHANLARPLQGRIQDSCPPFKEGHLLLSVRNLSLIGIVDLENETLSWAHTSMWRFQHDPFITPQGTMLLFDNVGQKGRSRVLEIDPCSMEVKWSYRDGVHGPLYTSLIGAVQRLPNGNTLIVESDRGRAFEVTIEHNIVWEYLNPHRAGKNNNLIATLFQMVRLAPDFGECDQQGCFQ